MWRACGRCGGIHPSGYKCAAHRTYAQYGGTDEQKFRSSGKWRAKSEEIREASKHLCSVCYDQGIYNYKDLEVHHIEKLRENRDKALDNENLIALCTMHHKLADAGEISKEYLAKLVAEREERPPLDV